MNPLFPNLDQFQELAASADTGPVVMLNLTAFRSGGGAGGAAFARWAEKAVPMIESAGGKVLFAGRGDQVLIGDAAEPWDMVALTWWPSRRAFLEMVTSPAYREANERRERAVDRTIMVACTPLLDDLQRKD